jgi:hypothetical protein
MHAFAAMMLVVGVGMLFGKGGMRAVSGNVPCDDPRLMASILAGAGVGLVTGFLGVGGGFLVVPALLAFAGLDMREAVGTSLLVIAINSAAGFVGHLGGGQLDAGLIAVLTAAAVAGALVGERVARHVSTLKLRRGFGLIVVAVGVTVVLAGGFGGVRQGIGGAVQVVDANDLQVARRECLTAQGERDAVQDGRGSVERCDVRTCANWQGERGTLITLFARKGGAARGTGLA